MKLFVTGATGFIGSHFVKLALEGGNEILAIRRPNSRTRIPLDRDPSWLVGDLETDCTEALKVCDTFVHLASHGVVNGTNDWQECFRWNVTASLDLWIRAVEAGIRKFIICGSCFEYGKAGERYDRIPTTASLEPTGAYHSSKAAATMAALGLATDKRLQLLVLRPFHVYGEGEDTRRFWPSLKRAALAGDDFKITTGEYLRDFVAVQDVAAAFVNALQRSDFESGYPKIENVGTGTPRSLKAFAQSEWARLGATGALKIGAFPTPRNEVMSYIPLI